MVASGGDSVVYRAIQQGVNRPVAVKVITGDDNGVPAARYQRELEITVRLGRSHPNIVTVLDTQILPDGRPCIVMEYYELGSLQDQLRAYGPLPASAVVAAGTVVADALAYAHAQGVLHRDVKPQNILVLPTSYVLADFGLARQIDAGHTSSLELFSYRHASPQILDGELPAVADDVYSLGSTLFTLLDGRPPFAVDDPEADTALAYLRRARSELPRPIRSSDATPELLAIVDRCLAKRREERFPDAATLRDALRSVVTEARVWARAWQPQTLGAREVVAPLPLPAPLPPRPAPPIPGPPAPVESPTPVAAPMPTPLSPLPMSPLPMSPFPMSPLPIPPVSPAPIPPLPSGPVSPVPASPPVAWAPRRPSDAATERVLAEPIAPQWSDDSLGFDASVGIDDSVGYRRPRTGRRSPWLRVGILAVVALVAGTGLGLGGSWLLEKVRGDDGRDNSGQHPVPDFTGTLPSGATTAAFDPDLSPELLAATLQGGSIRLTWSDPTDGVATFVVVRTDIDPPKGLVSVDAGHTETSLAVATLSPQAERYCFRILAYAGATGQSDEVCTG